MKKIILILIFATVSNAMVIDRKNSNENSSSESTVSDGATSPGQSSVSSKAVSPPTNVKPPIKANFILCPPLKISAPINTSTPKKSNKKKKPLAIETSNEPEKENAFFSVYKWETNLNLMLSHNPDKFFVVKTGYSCGSDYTLYRVNDDLNEVHFQGKLSENQTADIIYGPESKFVDGIKWHGAPADRPDILKTISFDNDTRSLIFYNGLPKISISNDRGQILMEFELIKPSSTFDVTIFNNGNFVIFQRLTEEETTYIYYGHNKKGFQDQYQFILSLAPASPAAVAQQLADKDDNFFTYPMFQKLRHAAGIDYSFNNFIPLAPLKNTIGPDGHVKQMEKYPNNFNNQIPAKSKDLLPKDDNLANEQESSLQSFIDPESPTDSQFEKRADEMSEEDMIDLSKDKKDKEFNLKHISKWTASLVKQKHIKSPVINNAAKEPHKFFKRESMAKSYEKGFVTKNEFKAGERQADIYAFKDKVLISLIDKAKFLTPEIWDTINKKKLFDPIFDSTNQSNRQTQNITEAEKKDFFQAIAKCNIKEIDRLIKKGIRVNEITYNDHSPSEYARKKGREILILPLLLWDIFDKDALIKARDQIKRAKKKAKKKHNSIKMPNVKRTAVNEYIEEKEKPRKLIGNLTAGFLAESEIFDWHLFSKILFKNDNSVDLNQFNGTILYWIWNKYKNAPGERDLNKEARWAEMWKVIKDENLTEYISNCITDPWSLNFYLTRVDKERFDEAKNQSVAPKQDYQLSPDNEKRLLQAVSMGNIEVIDKFVQEGVNLAKIIVDGDRTLSQYAFDENQELLGVPLEDNLIWLHLFDRDKYQKLMNPSPSLKKQNHKKDSHIRNKNNLPQGKGPIIHDLIIFSPRDNDIHSDNADSSKIISLQ